MNAGKVLRNHRQTTHYLGGGHTVVARPGWNNLTWLVEESHPEHGSYIHHSSRARSEADLIAAMVAAAHSHTADELDQQGGAS